MQAMASNGNLQWLIDCSELQKVSSPRVLKETYLVYGSGVGVGVGVRMRVEVKWTVGLGVAVVVGNEDYMYAIIRNCGKYRMMMV